MTGQIGLRKIMRIIKAFILICGLLFISYLSLYRNLASADETKHTACFLMESGLKTQYIYDLNGNTMVEYNSYIYPKVDMDFGYSYSITNAYEIYADYLYGDGSALSGVLTSPMNSDLEMGNYSITDVDYIYVGEVWTSGLHTDVYTDGANYYGFVSWDSYDYDWDMQNDLDMNGYSIKEAYHIYSSMIHASYYSANGYEGYTGDLNDSEYNKIADVIGGIIVGVDY